MTTLVFLICMANGQCIQNAPQQVFQSVAQCEAAAGIILTEVDRQMAAGEIAPHASAYRCISWGTSS